MFIQNSFNKNKKNLFNTFIYEKKNILFNDENTYVENFYNINAVICSNILNKYLYVNKLKLNVINEYNCRINSENFLDKILMQHNHKINFSEINFLMNQYPILKNLKKNQKLYWFIDSKKNLQYLVVNMIPKEIRVYHRINANFTENIVRIKKCLNDDRSYQILFIGELGKTFIDSASFLGLREDYVMNIVNALQYQLNFKELHYKDRFAVLMSMILSNDYSISNKFIGARLHTAGKDYYLFQANDGYLYDRDAVRMGKFFIQFPVFKPFRISSNFNLHRLNPVTRQISPHSGVDFAVRIGTPVFSIGDGEVIVSKYSKIAGNYIVIKHNPHCVTRYMHLKKILVKLGQKVKCGEKIALSGNTGRSTGPHLHFEIWINHRPVNPLTTKIVNVKKLFGHERMIYLNQIKEIISILCFD